MKRFLLLICFILFTILNFSQAPQPSSKPRISGTVYVESKTSKISTTSRLKDIKVILIKQYISGTDQQFISSNKAKFCRNDEALFKKYAPRVSYTNSSGYYEFISLERDADYILIICDKTILVSVVSTGSRNANYTVKTKKITL